MSIARSIGFMLRIQPQVHAQINYQFNLRFIALIERIQDDESMKIIKHSTLGQRITARLQDMDKPQTWLAEKMNLSPEAISKWVLGKTDPKLSNLRMVAGILKCSVGYLAGDEQDASIADAVRIMSALTEDGRRNVLQGVIAVAAAQPKSVESKCA